MVLTSTAAQQLPGPSAPVVAVSADGHIGPRCREDLRPLCPRERLDEYDAWLALQTPENRPLAPKDMGQDRPHPAAADRARRQQQNRVPGHHDMHARLRDMDRDGVAAAVLFHNSQNDEEFPFMPPLGSFFFEPTVPAADLERVAVGMRMYDEWLAQACSIEPERHVGLVYLPLWDLPEAVRQLEWAREAGLRAVNFPAPRPGIRDYDDPAWDPFWSACEDLRMPLVTHSGVGNPSSWSGRLNSFLVALEASGWPVVKGLHRLIFGGVFERHPDLTIVYTEQTAQPSMWWPSANEEYDAIWRRRNWQIEDLCPRPPSEYLSENVFLAASFFHRAPDEPRRAADGGYERNVMWGSDYPHIEGALVDAGDGSSTIRTSLRYEFGDVPEGPLRLMVGENAIRVYGLDRDSLTAVATRIGAPTPAEAAVAPDPESIPAYWSGYD